MANSSNDSSVSLPLNIHCFMSTPSSFVLMSYCITTIVLLLPLSIFILCKALQQWWPSRSSATTRHSDCFTYHMVAIEIVGAVGWIICCFSVFRENVGPLFVGYLFGAFTFYGQTFFHMLTCLERYLAVVHPITYRNLRNQRGIRIRNICTCCIWLLCFAKITFLVHMIIAIDFVLHALALTLVFFCSVSVLHVLSGPGVQKSVDQSQRRAFFTIMSILGVLVLKFAASLMWTVLNNVEVDHMCLILAFTAWLNVPSSLVLPLLYLCRPGK